MLQDILCLFSMFGGISTVVVSKINVLYNGYYSWSFTFAIFINL